VTAPAVASYDNVAGNAYDKYHSANPVARWLMNGFLAAFEELVGLARPATAFEIGCGEGHLSMRLLDRGIDLAGCDLDAQIVADANRQSRAGGHGERFAARSVYDIAPGDISAGLIVCCEVLEHLPDPDRALQILASQRAGYWLFSVPREPLWRALNLARGKYIADFGNTPGHIRHWSAAGFRRMVERRFEVVERRVPLPWTMLLCTAKPG
jgi:2-polyprenyl-3-methyl-5-hydroxy-6-metoxy-1,4-benzoquinol methylase